MACECSWTSQSDRLSDTPFLDPTTAVQAIDRLHDVLRQLAITLRFRTVDIAMIKAWCA